MVRRHAHLTSDHLAPFADRLTALEVRDTNLAQGQKEKGLHRCKPLNFFIVSGAPGRIRTHDPLVRSQVLYPTELRALHANFITALWAGGQPGSPSCSPAWFVMLSDDSKRPGDFSSYGSHFGIQFEVPL